MKSISVYLEIVHRIHYIIFSDYYIRRATYRQMDFTRTRKMSFTDYIFAIIGNTKNSLQAGINAFLDTHKTGQMEYSKQAFSKGRQRIKPEAFEELFRATVDTFYEKTSGSKWRDYHILGIDGTRLNLPCTKELRELYGEQTSQGESQVQALVSCVYDLLDGMIVDVCLAGCTSSERDAAKQMIEAYDATRISNPVFVMDRGYPSAELIDTVLRTGHKFLMRCSTEFFRKMDLPEQDNVLEHKFAKLRYPVKIRVVKVPLDNGTTEYLITNLFETDISVEDFRYLYNLRWGIETKYNDVKNKLEIENFTGYSPVAVQQDFYATLFLANLEGALEYDLHDEIEAAHRKPENKYEYHMNTNLAISEMKQHVVEMVMTTSAIKKARLFRKIQSRLIKAVVPVRPDRSNPREKKHIAAKFSQNSKRP